MNNYIQAKEDFTLSLVKLNNSTKEGDYIFFPEPIIVECFNEVLTPKQIQTLTIETKHQDLFRDKICVGARITSIEISFINKNGKRVYILR